MYSSMTTATTTDHRRLAHASSRVGDNIATGCMFEVFVIRVHVLFFYFNVKKMGRSSSKKKNTPTRPAVFLCEPDKLGLSGLEHPTK